MAWKLLGALAAAAALVATAAGCNVSAGGTTSHCVSQTQCSGGTNLSLCTDQDQNGVCVGMAYKIGVASFTCNSCLDCAQAQNEAVQACATGGGSGGSSGASSGSGSGGDAGSGGNATCSAKSACGTSGVSYQECTTLAPNGSCQSIAYKTSDGHQFTCAGCTNCASAAQQLSQYCADPGTTPTTTCSGAVACGTGGLTYEQCTTSTGATCDSIQYRVSDGSTYTCASCGDCSLADQELTSYCESQGTPTTSCGSPVTCGSNGLTYSECTTYSASGTCLSIDYQVSDGATYTCSDCSSCTSAYDQVTSYCASQTSPTTSCSSSYSCGTGGDTYYYCTTSTGSTCDSIYYETSTGYTWTCTSCSDCTSAYDNVTSYCNSLGGGQTCGTTTCGSAATCCDCSGTMECITLSSGETCASFGCQ